MVPGQDNGVVTSFPYSAASLTVTFNQPGLYKLLATEVMSPGSTFDPATATAVLTTQPAEITVRVAADQVVFTTPPPSVFPPIHLSL